MCHVVRYKDKNYNFGNKVVCEVLSKEFRKKIVVLSTYTNHVMKIYVSGKGCFQNAI